MESEVARLISTRRANPEMTVRELAAACNLPLMRAKRLLSNARKEPGANVETLGAKFHKTLSELLLQEELQAVIHGVFEGIVMSETFLEDFARGVPRPIPPSFQDPAILYPLGGCKVVSTMVGMLGSPYTYEAKFEQRRFSSRSLQGGFFEVEEENSSENLLSMEVEAAKEILKERRDAGVTLTVRLVDIHAQENPREVTSQKGHFAHAFNIVMTAGPEVGTLETRLYSAYIDKDIRTWVKEKELRKHVDEVTKDINEVIGGQMRSKKIDGIWEKLFGVNLPDLTRKKWPIKAHVKILRSIWTLESLKDSADLFNASKWNFGLFM